MFANINEALVISRELNATPAVAGDVADMAAGILTDAHKYTRTLIRQGYPRLREIDNQFLNSKEPATRFEELIALIQQHIATADFNEQQIANINQVIVSIRDLVNSEAAGIEAAETMVNVYDLLLSCWNLAGIAAARLNDPSLLTQIAICLEGNISDAGGCMPGIVARLYPAYARLINYELSVQCEYNQLELYRNTLA